MIYDLDTIYNRGYVTYHYTKEYEESKKYWLEGVTLEDNGSMNNVGCYNSKLRLPWE